MSLSAASRRSFALGRSLPADQGRVGPRDLADLLSWPADCVAALTQRPHLKQRPLDAMIGGVVLRTHYSGYDNPGVALGWIEQALVQLGLLADDAQHCRNLHAVDISKHCRRLLLAHDGPMAASHVFRRMSSDANPEAPEAERHGSVTLRAWAEPKKRPM